MAATGSFMETPLVVWVSTFSTESVEYKAISDGTFLNDVMKQIDPRCTSEGIARRPANMKDRLNNWDILLKNIKSYYQEVLQQFIVMRLPNIITVSRAPDSDAAKEEVRKVLLLILGCAVQCERKEQFIENIKALDISTQHGIVEFIKEITDDTKNVFAIDVPLDHMDELSRAMHFHMRMLIGERDCYLEEMKELSTASEELDRAKDQIQTLQTAARMSNDSLTSSPETGSDKQAKQHMSVELAEMKSRMRKLRQELEEKTEYAVELQEELEEYKTETQKLRAENLELTQDARAVRTYRDEIDILKEKAARVDKCEAEITKYKERLNELDFYKTRVEELRDDNRVLVEQRNVLEEQVDAWRKREATVPELEAELVRFKQHAQDLTKQLDAERERIAELTEINARLEFDKKGSLLESATLEEELVNARLNKRGNSESLSDQLQEMTNAKLLRLDLENKRLAKRVQELQHASQQGVDNSHQLTELQKENHRLSKKLEKLQEVKSRESRDTVVIEQVNLDLRQQVINLEETIETVKESAGRQVRELEREKSELQETLQTLRERNEKTHDVRLKELERENKSVTENVKILNTQISTLQYEKRTLQKAHETLKANVEAVKEIEEENRCFEKENQELRRNLATLVLRCERYDKIEQECLDMEVENQKLQKMVESLQKTQTQIETIEQENINLTVELQHVKRNLEVVKNSSTRVVDLEHEKDILNREIQQLKRTLDNTKADKEKQEQLEASLLEREAENQKLQRQCESLAERVQEVETESTDFENQVESYKKAVENMKISLKRLEEVEREFKDLEQDSVRANREKAAFEKENKRLKQAVESKDSTVDELSSRVTQLERENKRIARVEERIEDTDSHVHELQRENTELRQQTGIDKRTLSTLREDLVTEKIKSQQLENELQRITHELDKVGLDKDKLLVAEQTNDESKYKALESMMEETYKSTVSIKEEKIAALESRLEESKKSNVRLVTEITEVRRNYEALQQRREEEVLIQQATQSVAHERERSPRSSHSTKLIMPQPNATKEILELKDQIITVERRNATLETEARSFQSQKADWQSQLSAAQSQHSRTQKQLDNLQEQYNKIQAQCANIQVENRTLQSQTASLMSQNGSLQKQLATTETAHDQLSRTHDELTSAHDSLTSDHEALTRLHEQLSTEYEALIAEHGSLKQNHKILRNEMKEIQDQNMILLREKETITDLKRTLEQDNEDLKIESQSRGALQLDYVRLKESMMKLENDKERSDREYRDLLAEHKSLKSEYNALKAKHSDLKMSFDDYTKQLNAMDVEVTKLANKCESLVQLNARLEEENRKLEEDYRQLMMQMQALLNQNQELLATSLQSKDQMHERTKEHLEQMQDLRRQKEKLEEKIMEQYKRYDPVKKKSRGFSLFRKLGKTKDKKAAEKRSQSLGPQEFAQYVHSGTEAENNSIDSGKRHRGYSLNRSPRLSKKSRALAKSTTALNHMQYDPYVFDDLRNLKGAKSSDNVNGPPSSFDDFWTTYKSRDYEWIVRTGKRGKLTSNSTMTGEEDEEEDDGLTLEEFLRECDKSPKSRRKWLIENRIDLDVSKASKVKTEEGPLSTMLSPNLGPRPAIVDKDTSLLASKQRSKSEMNISKLSTYSISPAAGENEHESRRDGSFQSPIMSTRPTSAYITSTPKYNTLAGTRSPAGRSDVSPGQRGHAPSVPSQQPQPQLPVGGSSSSCGSTVAPPNGGSKYLPLTPQLGGTRHLNGEHGQMPLRSRSAIGFSSPGDDAARPGGGVGSQESVEQQADMRRQNSGSSAGSGSIGSYNATARQGGAGSGYSPVTATSSSAHPSPHYPVNGGAPNMNSRSKSIPDGNAVHQRYPSTDSSGTERAMPTQQPYLGMPQGGGPLRTPASLRHLTGPLKASYIPPDHQNSASSMVSQDQYNPGNVRHLVQNFQKNVQQTQFNQSQQHVPSPTSPSTGQYSSNTSHHNSITPPHSTSALYHSQHPLSPPGSSINTSSRMTPHDMTSPTGPVPSHYSSLPRGGALSSVNSPASASLGNQPSPSRHDLPQYSSPQLSMSAKSRPPGSVEPGAPPRRTRPVSAGPLNSSSGSAFSIPAGNKPKSPGGYNGPSPDRRPSAQDTENNRQRVSYSGGSGGGGSGDTSRARGAALTRQYSGPEERLQPQGQAAPPPPPPNGGVGSPRDVPQGHSHGDGEPKKKPVWYEYGCV